MWEFYQLNEISLFVKQQTKVIFHGKCGGVQTNLILNLRNTSPSQKNSITAVGYLFSSLKKVKYTSLIWKIH